MNYVAKIIASATLAEGATGSTDLISATFGSPVPMSANLSSKLGLSHVQNMLTHLLAVLGARDFPYRLDVDHLPESDITLVKLSLDSCAALEMQITYVSETSSDFWPSKVDSLKALSQLIQLNFPALKVEAQRHLDPVNWQGYVNKVGIAGVGACDENQVFERLELDLSEPRTAEELALHLLAKHDRVTVVRDVDASLKLETLWADAPEEHSEPFRVQKLSELLVLAPGRV